MAYEFKSIGTIKTPLKKQLLMSGEKSDLLMELLLPELDDDRFDIYDNILGGNFEYYQSGKKIYIELVGRLFDVPFVYSTITNTMTAICFDVNITQCTPSTKELLITIDVVCHKNNLVLSSTEKSKFKKIGYEGNRLDIMVSLIGDLLNNNPLSDKCLGSLTPIRNNPTQSYFPQNDFFGKILRYTCSDFMTDYSERSMNGK